MTVADRIKDLRIKRGWTQEEFAHKMGQKDRSSVSQLESKGDKISLPLIEKAAKILGCSIPFLMGWDAVQSEHSTIYLLGRVAAGYPIFAEENIVGELDVPTIWAKKDEYYGLTIKGNSMEPRISNGDTVIVHSQEDAESGEIVIATINGDDAVCKRLMRYGDVTLLRSFNSEYDDIDVTTDHNFRIWGKVVETRHRF